MASSSVVAISDRKGEGTDSHLLLLNEPKQLNNFITNSPEKYSSIHASIHPSPIHPSLYHLSSLHHPFTHPSLNHPFIFSHLLLSVDPPIHPVCPSIHRHPFIYSSSIDPSISPSVHPSSIVSAPEDPCWSALLLSCVSTATPQLKTDVFLSSQLTTI